MATVDVAPGARGPLVREGLGRLLAADAGERVALVGEQGGEVASLVGGGQRDVQRVGRRVHERGRRPHPTRPRPPTSGARRSGSGRRRERRVTLATTLSASGSRATRLAKRACASAGSVTRVKVQEVRGMRQLWQTGRATVANRLTGTRPARPGSDVGDHLGVGHREPRVGVRRPRLPGGADAPPARRRVDEPALERLRREGRLERAAGPGAAPPRALLGRRVGPQRRRRRESGQPGGVRPGDEVAAGVGLGVVEARERR